MLRKLLIIMTLTAFGLLSAIVFAADSQTTEMIEDNPSDEPADSPTVAKTPQKTTKFVPKRDYKGLPCMSLGPASKGALINGKPLPSSRHWINRGKDRQYSTPEVIKGMEKAMRAFIRRYPNSCRLVTGDVSFKHGGKMGRHRSHQSGRDIDIGLYAKNNTPLTYFVDMNKSNLDVEKSWAFMEALMENADIQFILVDYSLQELFYLHVKHRLGADAEYLNRVFQYPKGPRERSGIIRHAPGHKNHLHVRFHALKSIRAAKIHRDRLEPEYAAMVDPNNIAPSSVFSYVPRVKLEDRIKGSGPAVFWAGTALSLAETAIETHYVVAKGDTLDSIAARYHISTEELARRNGIKPRKRLRPGMQLKVRDGSSVPFISRRLSGLIPKWQELSKIDTEPVVYSVKKGDTLWSISDEFGVQPGQICQWNDITFKTMLAPGEKIFINKKQVLDSVAKPIAISPEMLIAGGNAKPGSLRERLVQAWRNITWAKVKNILKIFS